jgi:HEAT repeat protein
MKSMRIRHLSPAAAAALAVAILAGATACQSGSTPPPAQPGKASGTAPGGDPTLADLRAALNDPEVVVRIRACDELGKRAATSPEAVEMLAGALKDKEPLVRRFAAGGMANAKSPTPSQARALAALLSDAETDPRESASRTLATLGPRIPDEAVVDVASALAAAVPDTQEQVRRNVLEALGTLGPRGPRAVPAVQPAVERALSDPAESTRSAAVTAVGAWGTEVSGAVTLLATALSDSSHDVRKMAVISLEKMGPQAAGATKAIARLLHGKEIYLRVFAADALAAIGPGAKAALPELKAMAKKGYKDIQNSPEMEAKELPEAVQKAIAAIEGKDAKGKAPAKR